MSADLKDIFDLYQEEREEINKRFIKKIKDVGQVKSPISEGLHEISWPGAETSDRQTTLSMNFFALAARRYSGALTLISPNNPDLDREFWCQNAVMPGRLISVGCAPRKVPLLAEKICLEGYEGLIGIIPRTTFPYSILRKIRDGIFDKKVSVVFIRPSAQSSPAHQSLFASRWSLKAGIATNEDNAGCYLSLRSEHSQDIKLAMPS
ncbi:hypothetical protein [Acetobacter persici]|uniref:Uncharacterized protein n=1 Tax=Acetobacter persici TaxID=1076596 RepID=A0A1U9LIM3_9PROT|nr:hypothetical protein [Acetobacter persici]AQT06303.1 hypothetical protein A0U91_14855 [Acetobacter persici]